MSYILYYAELCPNEPSWVHEQLSEERVRLEKEVYDLKVALYSARQALL